MKKVSRDYSSLSSCVNRILNKRIQIESKRRSYGLDMELSCTEIHIIDEIGRCPEIGVKGIACNRGVTEGAVSQIVKKLIAKKLIKKRISEQSEARVSLTLTEQGRICFENHVAFHKEFDKKWYSILDKIEDEDLKKIEMVLSEIEKITEV